MSTSPPTIALHLIIPAAVVAACGTQVQLRAALTQAGLLPATGQEERWQIDPLSQGWSVQGRVPLAVEARP